MQFFEYIKEKFLLDLEFIKNYWWLYLLIIIVGGLVSYFFKR
ncbi:MAG: hypothetical protein ACOCP8_00890 [archaeon]